MMRFRCSTCRKSLKAPDDAPGRKFSCPRCGQQMRVPPPEQSGTNLAERLPPQTPWSTTSAPPPVRRPPLTQADLPAKWHHTNGGIPQPVPVVWENLRRMADAGQLQPDDLVKEEGETGWQRAGSFPDLWPEVCETDEQPEIEDEPASVSTAAPMTPAVPESPLTACTVCGREIAKEAKACPGCGAPNRWTHPEIVRFLKRLHWFDDIPNFEVEGRGYRLVGKSTRGQQFTDVAAGAVGGLGFIAPMTGAGLLGALGASIGAHYASEALRNSAGRGVQFFVIDFRYPEPFWQSTDDYFWGDVMDFFKL